VTERISDMRASRSLLATSIMLVFAVAIVTLPSAFTPSRLEPYKELSLNKNLVLAGDTAPPCSGNSCGDRGGGRKTKNNSPP
jgi:hypothetical protein